MISGFLRRQYGWIGGSLYRKYVLVISLFVAAALLFSGGLDIFFTYKDKLGSISDLEQERAYSAASNIDIFIGDVQRKLEQAAQVEYEDNDSGMIAREEDYLALVNRAAAITNLGYWNSMGQERFMVAQFSRETFTNYSPLEVEQLLIGAKTNGTFNGPVYFDDDSSQRMTIGVAEPGSGEGVLIAEVDLTFVQVIISQLSLDDSGWAYVVDSNGTIVAHPAKEHVTQRTNVFHLPQVQAAIKDAAISNSGSATEKAVTIEKSLDGHTVLAASYPIWNLDWNLLVERPRSQALASLKGPIVRCVSLLVGAIVLAVLISLILARKMVSPIQKLKDDADKLGLGSTDEAVGLDTGDELDTVGQALTRMSNQVKESYETLEERVEQRTKELVRSNAKLESELIARKEAESIVFLHQMAMEHSPIVVLITDADANIEYVNPKFTEVTGYTMEEVVGKKPNILQSGRTNREKYERLWETIRNGDEWEGDLYNKRKDGKFYWSHEKILPIKDIHGMTTHYLAVEEDVTEKKNAEEIAKIANQRLGEMNRTLEQRVTERTLDLQEANDRLIEAHDQLVRTEKLAAIGELAAGVAHDLRNPLGAIKNAIYYLNGKLFDTTLAKENPRIPEFLKIIDDEVGNSNKIITDLMDFARISAPTFSPADIGTLVQDCLGKLELNEGIYINIQDSHQGDQMQVQADGRQLHRVFQNLIQNAQDAMPDGGVITVSTKENAGFAEVAVSDIGGGIKPEHLGKVFDPLFTTKTKGTGLGLAVCHQIVARHGGMIEVKSRPGEGAVFKVKLPVTAHEDRVRGGMAQEALNASS